MTIKTFTFNPFQENTYLIYDETGNAAIIDAGCLQQSERLFLKNFISENELTLKKVLNTHLHLDHQFGNKFLFETYGISPEVGEEDVFLLENVAQQAAMFGLPLQESAQQPGAFLTDKQRIVVGNMELLALHCPGHSPGSMCLYAEKDGVLFAGDVLFQGSIGRTDLQKGDYATLICSITTQLLVLPDETVVYSGHGATTTIGNEKKFNPNL